MKIKVKHMSLNIYLYIIKSHRDQLSLVRALLQEDDLIFHYLNGIKPKLKEISGVIWAKEK